MNWNFNYAIPSFIVLSFFVIYYFIKPNILVRSNKYFLTLIIFEILGFLSDVISSYLDGYSTLFNRNWLIFLNASYFIIYIIRYFIVSLFFASVLKIRIKKDIPTIITAIIIFIILFLIIINPFTEFLYFLDSNEKYFRAKNYLLIYYAAFSTLILDLYYIIRYRKKLEKKEIVSSIFTIIALLSGSLLKIFFVRYLLLDMFFLFVIVALFLTFENPEIYIERKTGLYNKKAFNDITMEYFFKNKKFAIITFFIKNYSEVREIYGASQIDFALREIGKYFSITYPKKKIFYLRNGLFSIFESNSKDFELIRENTTRRFKRAWTVKNSQIHLKVATVELDEDVKINAIDDIYSCLKMGFYESKNSFDNHIKIDKTSINEIAYNSKVSKALNKSLLNDDLQLYLQPIVDSKSRKIIAAEALVRLYDEELGLITPGEFIKMAEKNGSIEQLGDQILNKVCIFLKESEVNKYGIKWINVNLSPIQCQNNQLPEKIDSIIDMHTIQHDFIHLEITEDSMIDSQTLKRQMNILITDGYDFSLDDFGTGFSNITRLQNFPFNNIKLDMSIVHEHFKSPDNILPSIVQAFISRGLSVTAEGVETKEMADGLEKMGCAYLQGYYFSKPIPYFEFENLIKMEND